MMSSQSQQGAVACLKEVGGYEGNNNNNKNDDDDDEHAIQSMINNVITLLS